MQDSKRNLRVTKKKTLWQHSVERRQVLTNHSTRVSTAARTCPLERRGSVSKEQYRCMGAKFSVLPQRNETDAQMSERGTLAVYIERLVRIGCQLVARRHGGGGAPSVRARGSAPVHFPRTGIVSTPLTQAPTEWAIFLISLLVFTILPLI